MINKILKSKFNNNNLDIEFAFDTSDKLFIFQARPITNQEVIQNYTKYDIRNSIDNIKESYYI